MALGSIDGVECSITVDTGSNVSIIRPDVLSEESRASVQPVSSYLRTVTGATAPILGCGRLKVQVGAFKAQHEIWVAEVADECILGLDFLERHRCHVDLGEGVLHVDHHQVPLQKPTTAEFKACRVITRSNVDLPPCSEVIVPATAVDVPAGARWGLIESRHATNGVLVGKTLVDLGRAGVPVRVMNLSDHPQRIKRGQELASCEPISSVVSGSPSNHDSCDSTSCLADHLKPLYERCVTDLQPHQRQEVIELLCRNADVFSCSQEDLGRTDIAKHHIETNSAPPIRQLPRRLPSVKREEAKNAVEQMAQQGLIEPSTSPWASPVVLVKKRDGSWRFCVDYRKLNDVTKKDSYPLPRIDDTLETLAGTEWFSTLDLKSGYHQVEMDP